MLVKAEYYSYNDDGYVVVYIKGSEYDYIGRPYVFCGISYDRWNSFTSSGIYKSWGESFHNYIMDYKCNCI
jgi:hypothetical protein